MQLIIAKPLPKSPALNVHTTGPKLKFQPNRSLIYTSIHTSPLNVFSWYILLGLYKNFELDVDAVRQGERHLRSDWMIKSAHIVKWSRSDWFVIDCFGGLLSGTWCMTGGSWPVWQRPSISISAQRAARPQARTGDATCLWDERNTSRRTHVQQVYMKSLHLHTNVLNSE